LRRLVTAARGRLRTSTEERLGRTGLSVALEAAEDHRPDPCDRGEVVLGIVVAEARVLEHEVGLRLVLLEVPRDLRALPAGEVAEAGPQDAPPRLQLVHPHPGRHRRSREAEYSDGAFLRLGLVVGRPEGGLALLRGDRVEDGLRPGLDLQCQLHVATHLALLSLQSSVRFGPSVVGYLR